MIAQLCLIPALAALVAFVLRGHEMRRRLLVGAAAAHALLLLCVWVKRPQAAPGAWLALDDLGLLFLSIISVLFLVTALYCIGYLRREQARLKEKVPAIFPRLVNSPEQVFSGCLLLFLAAMSLAVISQHAGLLWFALEATTLVSAPLIYFHRTGRSLEAMWKYLLICSIGIALALLGTFFLAVAAGPATELLFSNLLSAPPQGASVAWLKLAFIFFLVGYGTKTGLAPFHTWLPDAHSEAPSVISALLSGALLNCALLAILRTHRICIAAGVGGFSSGLLIFFGLLSLAFAALFIVRQQDFKRLLAYSSVEHMGIVALAVGLGGIGTFAALLHAINHSLTKGMLFLVAGNILSVYRDKSVRKVAGVLHVLPISGSMWVAGLLAITGLPPFGLFVSELLILKAALDGGHLLVVILLIALLAIIFVAMAAIILGMAQGTLPSLSALRGYVTYSGSSRREPVLAVASPLVLAVLIVLLGLYLPGWLTTTLKSAAGIVGGGL